MNNSYGMKGDQNNIRSLLVWHFYKTIWAEQSQSLMDFLMFEDSLLSGNVLPTVQLASDLDHQPELSS